MFHIYVLGSSEGLLFDVPVAPYPRALWDPLEAYLVARGAEVCVGDPVLAVEPHPGGAGFTVETNGAGRRFDAVVLVPDTAGLRALVEGSPGLGGPAWRERVTHLRTAPPFLVSRLWLDRPVAANRPGFLGTSGYGPLDNVSVLERWEDEAAAWTARTGGSVVELHPYAVPDHVERASLQRLLLDELHRVYPETRVSRVIDARHEWRADCPFFTVGGHRDRPGVMTPHPGLVLAGDLVRTDLPVALMERAATTGFLATNVLLRGWGAHGHALRTVPDRGRSALLRAAARLA